MKHRIVASDCLDDWYTRWPNFPPTEPGVGCGGCTQDSPCHRDRLAIDAAAFDKVQWVRNEFGGPLTLNSTFRCAYHNAVVDGAAKSCHRTGTAFDISVRDARGGLKPVAERARLYEICVRAGFTGFGFYTTFLHVDIGRTRSWVIGGGKTTWSFLLAS